MSTVTAPGMTTTSTGAPLPLVALPRGELLCVDEAEIPLLENALGGGIHFKPLRLDLERNEWVLLVTAAPGVELPLHYHTGPAEVFTLQGRWLYREYPDQPQTAGCYLYEPGGSVHRFHTPADNTEDTIALVRVAGANVNFNDDGSFHSILDAMSMRYLTELLGPTAGRGDVRFIGGAETAYTAA
jgi:quercetin dioxygenase-like cupin family protein